MTFIAALYRWLNDACDDPRTDGDSTSLTSFMYTYITSPDRGVGLCPPLHPKSKQGDWVQTNHKLNVD